MKKALWTKTAGGLKPHGHALAKPKKPMRIRRVSKRNAARYREYHAKAKAFISAARARLECCPVVFHIPELWSQPTGFRLREVTDTHHMRGKLGPLRMDERHWLAVSREGHVWIDANREKARERGWLCAKGLWNVPDNSPRK